MADRITSEVRSRNMAAIKGRDTIPEVVFRKKLFAKGLRYRKNVRALPGCPDIVLPKYKAVIFVNGCFWHMHNCDRFRWPKTNPEFWENKILGNVDRDKQNYKKLREQGWKVIVVWECEIKKDLDEIVDKTIEQIKL